MQTKTTKKSYFYLKLSMPLYVFYIAKMSCNHPGKHSDPPPPKKKKKNAPLDVNKSAPNHPDKPLHTSPPPHLSGNAHIYGNNTFQNGAFL